VTTSTLPDRLLVATGPVTALFIARGIMNVGAAFRHVEGLPYARISDRSDLALVLKEGCGTCTTKHALLSLLLREQGIDVALTLGIFEMSELNTPGVGRVLEQHGLTSILEAHCYLRHAGGRIDITRDVPAAAPIERFLHEESITPDQIGDYKIALHHAYLDRWRRESGLASRWTLDEIWRIREDCIAALSGADIR
jgi:hypothetical protein